MPMSSLLGFRYRPIEPRATGDVASGANPYGDEIERQESARELVGFNPQARRQDERRKLRGAAGEPAASEASAVSSKRPLGCLLAVSRESQAEEYPKEEELKRNPRGFAGSKEIRAACQHCEHQIRWGVRKDSCGGDRLER
jgi:hypothetical protein